MKQISLVALFTLSFIVLKAQYFVPELSSDQINRGKEAYAVTNAGDTVSGRVTTVMLAMGQLRSFTIKKDDGSKAKFKSADVKSLAIKPSKIANMESAMSVQSVMTASSINFDEVINREWVYFEKALLPKKKDKPVMMQLLNPGFDSKIKVYLNPNAKETKGVSLGGIKVTGGDDKSYLVVFDGNKSVVYKKSKYKKEALSQLYKDCSVFTENYAGEKFKWRYFAEHVFVYDQLCD